MIEGSNKLMPSATRRIVRKDDKVSCLLVNGKEIHGIVFVASSMFFERFCFDITFLRL
jgi:hypothetical protein